MNGVDPNKLVTMEVPLNQPNLTDNQNLPSSADAENKALLEKESNV